MAHIDHMHHNARGAVNRAQHSDTFENLTRIGFIAKGIVYLFIGVLAFMAAFGGAGGETTGREGAISRIAAQPFGEFLLAAIAVGLFAYAAWRMLCAFADVEGEGSDSKGLAKRVGYFFSGFFYGAAGVYALQLLIGFGSRGGGGGGAQSAQTWSARLMSMPAGQWLLALVGIATVVVGFGLIRYGWQEKFVRHLRAVSTHGWVRELGKWGYIARGVVFGVIGILVVIAAMQHDPSEVQGLEGALDTLARQPFGTWLLAFVGAGLACYGAFCVAESKYRQVNT